MVQLLSILMEINIGLKMDYAIEKMDQLLNGIMALKNGGKM